MRCWKCGVENKSTEGYCTACAASLVDPRKRDEIKWSYREIIPSLLSRIAKAFILSLILSTMTIGLIAAMVGLYDSIVDHRMLAGLGLLLTAFGSFIAFSSAYALNRIPERVALSNRHRWKSKIHPVVLYNTIFSPLWNALRMEPLAASEMRSIILIMTGSMVFIIGLFLM